MGQGLLLPRGVAQPFDLKALRDDLHVMAYFKGHARYEAVEAMIRHPPSGEPFIRAIVTRHDQSQTTAKTARRSSWRCTLRGNLRRNARG